MPEHEPQYCGVKPSDDTVVLETLRVQKGLGPRRLKALAEVCPRLQDLVSMARSDVRGLDGVGPWLAEYLPAKLDLVAAATRLAEAASLGAAPLGLTDPGYPHRLRAIYDPPSILFVTGDPQAFQGVATLGIVGARRASQHGTEMAQRLGAELVQAGVAVISGLAYGIDGAAHRGALAGHGKTVAVLASRSDQITPAAHTTLAHEIVAGGGALVSEYPPGTEAKGGTFQPATGL